MNEYADIKPKKYILLTGAGFSKAFGGLLASEMWSQLFNHKKLTDEVKLKSIFREEVNFEKAYQTVINYNDKKQIELFQTCLFDAYNYLEQLFIEYAHLLKEPNISRINDIFKNFYGDDNSSGFIFTLNQDLLVERRYRSQENHDPKPGILYLNEHYEKIPQNFTAGLNIENIQLNVELADFNPEIEVNNTYYIKLHGSSNWTKNGNRLMVIGESKSEMIQSTEVLKKYLKIFSNVLNCDHRKLMIIGYSFMDSHINDLILKGIQGNKLELCIINPKNFSEFKVEILENKIPGIHEKLLFLNAINNYYPCTLESLFPNKWNKIWDEYFI